MTNQLQVNLDAILDDKNTNLLPENLKAGVTCLGVTGALETPEGMPVFESEAEMIAAKDTMEIGDECIVWDSEQASLDRGDRTGPILVGLYRKVSEEVADDPSVPFYRYYGQSRVIDVVNAELVYTAGDEEFGDEIEIELSAHNDGGLVRGAKGGYGLDPEQVAEQLGLTADKLVKGNRILNIEGTAEVGGTTEGAVKLFSSVDEMNADTDAKEGDLALVYTSKGPVSSTSRFSKATFPTTVVLPEAVTDSIDVRWATDDDSFAMFHCSRLVR